MIKQPKVQKAFRHFVESVLFSFVMLIFVSCVHTNQQSAREIVDGIPAKHLENYSFDSASPITSRIAEAPSFLLDYLQQIDNVEEYRPYLPNKTEIQLIDSYIELLPPLNKTTIQDRLIGIYFIEDFLGSGLTDYVLGPNDEIYTVLIVNAASLEANLSEWMTYREMSCFIEDEEEISIVINCGNKYSGLLYVLLHETTHVVDMVHSITPYTEWSLAEIKNDNTAETTPFTESVWKSYSEPVRQYQKYFMRDITFYGFSDGPKIAISDSESVYSGLSETPLTSLYSCLSWAEDFAEFVTWYHLTSKLDQPYVIDLSKDGQTVFQFHPMDQESVQRRIKTISSLYNQ